MRLLSCILLSLSLGSVALCARANPDGADGTVGIDVLQLYGSSAPNNLGYLIVVDVAEASPAAQAGIQNGDVIIGIDGVDLKGKSLDDSAKPLKGTVGGKVHLKVRRLSENRMFEVDLVRSPTGPRGNPARETFSYRWMGDWSLECTTFPLSWSPQIPYRGLEDLLFAPGFADKSSAQYHSYGFVWWLEGMQPLAMDRLRSDLVEYFKGISAQRGRAGNFNPDPNKVSVTLGSGPLDQKTTGKPARRHLHGDITLYNREGELITLHSDVAIEPCHDENHTAAVFLLSPQRDEDVWKSLRAFQDSFQCDRK